MSQRICLLGGDGIGPEVIAQAEIVLNALALDLEFVRGEIGFGAYQKYGTPLPQATLEQITASQATLFGAVTTPPAIDSTPATTGSSSSWVVHSGASSSSRVTVLISGRTTSRFSL